MKLNNSQRKTIKYINYAVIVYTSIIQEKDRKKIINWLENRENKSKDEIAALECAKKNNKFVLGIFFFFIFIIFIIAWVTILDNTEENQISRIINMSLILIALVFIFIKILSIVERDFTKLVERITRFTDLYINEYVTTFDKPNMLDSDFASNFIDYENQNKNDFEEQWSKIKPFTFIEKLNQKISVFVVLLIIFGIPLFINFKDSGLTFEKLIYSNELRRSEYVIVEQERIDHDQYIVIIEYVIDGKEYKTEVKVNGNYSWVTQGRFYYRSNAPEKIIYIKN